MKISVRSAGVADIDPLVDLLLEDADARATGDRVLWKLAADARDKLVQTIKGVMQNDAPPFRQQWLLAEQGGRAVGVVHSILLPVPPIYAGGQGMPGLIMEGSFVREDAPAGTAEALLSAAEDDLREAGARILLASSVADGACENVLRGRKYAALTLYLGKVGLEVAKATESVRPALESDVPDIVKASAQNREILEMLDIFWAAHPEADARFGGWMHRSLALTDRDMFVAEGQGGFEGYAIAQPATPLHFPTPHDIGAIGIIDDYFHADFADPATLDGAGSGAAEALTVAEGALHARGNEAALIVCPAAWTSKIEVLEAAGYRTAMTWFIKR